jgi:hypothetical protein
VVNTHAANASSNLTYTILRLCAVQRKEDAVLGDMPPLRCRRLRLAGNERQLRRRCMTGTSARQEAPSAPHRSEP